MAASTRLSMPFGHVWAMNVGLRDGIDGFAHRPVVMAGGHDQVDLFELAIIFGPIVMDQRAARGFDDAHALTLHIRSGVQDFGAENIGVIQQDAHAFGGKEGFDQAGIMVVQCIFDRFAGD